MQETLGFSVSSPYSAYAGRLSNQKVATLGVGSFLGVSIAVAGNLLTDGNWRLGFRVRQIEATACGRSGGKNFNPSSRLFVIVRSDGKCYSRSL
jgi:hypothetical protein